MSTRIHSKMAGVFLPLATGLLIVAVCAGAVKGGAMLAAPATEPAAGDGHWRPFRTQARRGRFLVIVATVAAIGASYCRNVGAGEADRATARRVEEIRAALAGTPPVSSGLPSGRA